ncbi:hypothetical protein [Streptomyces sp. NPDC002599]|uniref:hypothetical protein n=1 Tax=Streptomyces sp. NPDC002599 TaxID=3154421 RepID=UPI0033192259
MRRRTIAAAAAISSGLLVTTLTTSAHADTLTTLSCSTTGAFGQLSSTNWRSGTTGEFDVTMSVTDTKADDHHVRVRLVGKTIGATRVNWPWHSVTGGLGSEDAWARPAQNSAGVIDIGVQVARYEKSEYMNSCTDWAVGSG